MHEIFLTLSFIGMVLIPCVVSISSKHQLDDEA